MLDLSHIPNSQQDIQIFYASAGTNQWQTWRKPKKCNYVYIICIGGAGGGAGGYGTNTAFVVNTAGGGGAVSRALYNSQQIPDVLFVQVGLGGAGGAGGVSSGGAGGAGSRSWVALQPASVIAAQNIIMGSGQTNAGGGQGPTGAAILGEGGIVQSSASFLTLSNFLTANGNATIANGGFINVDITPLNSQITTAGGAGGTYNSGTTVAGSGSSISATAVSPLILGGSGSTTGNGGDGANGITSWKPFYSLGGAGGGGSLAIGGNGGNGGIGSGGGAGGNGLARGGNGGKGGDGLVIIISF